MAATLCGFAARNYRILCAVRPPAFLDLRSSALTPWCTTRAFSGKEIPNLEEMNSESARNCRVGLHGIDNRWENGGRSQDFGFQSTRLFIRRGRARVFLRSSTGHRRRHNLEFHRRDARTHRGGPNALRVGARPPLDLDFVTRRLSTPPLPHSLLRHSADTRGASSAAKHPPSPPTLPRDLLIRAIGVIRGSLSAQIDQVGSAFG